MNDWVLSLNIKIKTKISALTASIQHYADCSNQGNYARKRNKGIQFGKVKIKWSLLAKDIIFYTENLRDTHTQLELIISAKVKNIGSHKYQLHFYIWARNNLEIKLTK